MSFESNFEYKGMTLNPKEMWFLSLTTERDPSLLGLRIGIKDLDEGDIPKATEAVRAFLDHGLGEKTAADEIQHLEVVRAPDEAEKIGFVWMPELTTFIKWRKTHKCEADDAPK
ncbi:MAG: hypothetical protein GY854_21145 [Deltaproteobacteria bacterium]|nr:hypothetical protein [Deltaproteobacteria bacterium]